MVARCGKSRASRLNDTCTHATVLLPLCKASRNLQSNPEGRIRNPNSIIQYTMGSFSASQFFILCLVAVISTVLTGYWLRRATGTLPPPPTAPSPTVRPPTEPAPTAPSPIVPPPTVPSPIPSPTESPVPTRTTFRVRGIPAEWDADRLQAFLTDGDSVPNIKSLASDIDGRSSSATVTYENVPASLRNTPPEPCQILLPRDPQAQSLRDEYLVLDANFHGMTTLFAPPEKDHKLE